MPSTPALCLARFLGRRRVRHGIAATEFALVLPLICLLGLGCLQVGRMVQHYLVVTHAANVGAQHAATHGFTQYTREAWESRVRAVVQEELKAGLRPASDDYAILIDTEQDKNMEELPLITVRVTYDSIGTFRWPGLPQRVRLQREVCVRRYR